MNESYYLESITKPQPGDSFPNVGYVRRFVAIANHPEQES